MFAAVISTIGDWLQVSANPFSQPYDNTKGAAILYCSNSDKPWPAYMVSDWEPFTCGSVSEPCYDHAGGNQIWYNNMFPSNRTTMVVDLSLFDGNTSNQTADWIPKLGANPYNLPAIWGDQSDFTNATNTNWSLAGTNANNQAVFDENTILKLRQDWYYLWFGKDKVDKDWPRARHSKHSWCIDKGGAARGYAGNGGWDDGNVSKIQ